MVLVFDQMRAEYIERFDLPNFKRAQALGVNFDNGYVGHLEANTIISHPVITTGKLPRNMPWAAQVMKDVRGLVGPKDAFYIPARLSSQQWLSMHQKTSGDSSLLARIAEVNEGPTFSVAQKKYAAYNYGGPYADTIIALDTTFKSGPFKGHHSVGGENVPEYISQPVGNRYYLEGLNRWGSEVERYALKGSGYVTGTDPFRPGGDAWVGDVVEQIMEREQDWAAIMASFGAIDKVSHVLGEHDAPTQAEWALKHGISLQDTLQKADQELGRILDRLEEQELLSETVLVITADHGGQRNSKFHGRMVSGRHPYDSYYGKGENFDFTEGYSPAIEPMVQTGLLEALSMDTLALFWTKPLENAQIRDLTAKIAQMNGVAEVYIKNSQGNYTLLARNPALKGKELAWAMQHNQGLANSLGGPAGPTFVATMFDNNGYAMVGAHGGAQEMVQRIPMIVISPNLARQGGRSKAWVRLVDVNPIVGRLLDLRDHPGLDGNYRGVLPFLNP